MAEKTKATTATANSEATKKTILLDVPPVVVPTIIRPLQGFLDFVRQQGVIGLAVGLVLGTAAKEVVDSIVRSFIEPLLGLLLPRADNLSEASFYIRDSEFMYGSFLSVIIRFLSIAAVIYFIVHGLKLDRLDKKKE